MAESGDERFARQLDELNRELVEISRRAEERHQQLLAQGDHLLERGRASERIFIDALVDIDASMKKSNERSDEITQSIRDMRESIRANTRAVLSVLDRLGPAPGAG